MTSSWPLPTRLLFRFCFVYFGLYVLTTQMLNGLLPSPIPGFRPLEQLPPLLPVFTWTATHVLHLASPPVVLSGSGDKYLNWIAAGWLLAFSTAATLVWSVVDRRRTDDATLHKWFRVFLRFALGTTMIGYGFVKVFPLQMPYPPLSRLVEPYGNFSPMGVLWYSIGASPAYEIFVGAAEALGGILLFIPRTALLGSLIVLADTIEVFVLNMTYDVPVKLFSFHLVLMALFLLAPDAKRLLRLVLLDQAVGPSTVPPLATGPRAKRVVAGVQILFGAWCVWSAVAGDLRSWRQTRTTMQQVFHNTSVAVLYGIWNVDEMAIDQIPRAPLVPDDSRWRRVIVQPGGLVRFQRMDDSFVDYRMKTDAEAGSLTLTKAGDPNWQASFTSERPTFDRLTLDGSMDGHATRMTLSRVDPNAFLLVNRGFHWIQEFPFNR